MCALLALAHAACGRGAVAALRPLAARVGGWAVSGLLLLALAACGRDQPAAETVPDGLVCRGLAAPSAMVVDPRGGLLVAEMRRGQLSRVDEPSPNASGGLGHVADVVEPCGLALDAGGRVWVTSHADGALLACEPDGECRAVLRGLAAPAGLALDGAGELLLAEREAGRVLRVVIDAANEADGAVQVLAEGLTEPLAVAVPDAPGAPGAGSVAVLCRSGEVVLLRPGLAPRRLETRALPGSLGLLADSADGVLAAAPGGGILRIDVAADAGRVVWDAPVRVMALGRAADGGVLAASWGRGWVRRVEIPGRP